MTESVLIVGCGVFGLSTAIELAKRHYNVTALDINQIPSSCSAANDHNKIIRTEYSDLLYTKLALEAVDQWKTDPDLSCCYIECGRLSVKPINSEKRMKFDKISRENLKSLGKGVQIKSVQGGKDLAHNFSEFRGNRFEDDTIIEFNPTCALGLAGKSLKCAMRKAERLGVKFVFGRSGNVVNIYEEEDKAIVEAEDGKKYTADKILVCCGALTGHLVNLNGQTSASGLFVAHVQLNDEEYERLKNIPIFFSAEGCYFFPPDEDTKMIKIASATEECRNSMVDRFGNVTSLPLALNEKHFKGIPSDAVDSMHAFFRKAIPEIADRELVNCKICWINDTNNSDFLIDKVPTSRAIYVASGDSGHAYKFLPNIGKYVADRMENRLAHNIKDKWKWSYETKHKNPSWRIEKKLFELGRKNITTNEMKSKF